MAQKTARKSPGGGQTDRATLRLFWQAGLEHRGLLVLAMFTPVGTVLMGVGVPMVIGKLLGALGTQPARAAHFVPYFVGLALAGALFNRIGFVSLMKHQAHTMGILQRQAFEALLKRSVGFHNNNMGGKLVSDAIDFPSAYSLLASAVFNNLLPFLCVLIGGSAFIFAQSWQLGLVITAMAMYALLSGLWDSKRRAPVRARRLIATKAVTGHLADSILNIQTIKTFAREPDELAEHRKLNRRQLKLRLRDWASAGRSGNNRVFVLYLMQFVFLLVTLRLVRQDPRLLSTGIFAFSFTITISNQLFNINMMMRNIEDGLLQASPMTEILQETPEIADKPGAPALTVPRGEITARGVTFRYMDAAEHDTVFANLSLHIKPGEKVGLVGPSGGGKSTLTRLLLRFDDINSGAIAIDGQDISAVTQASLRQAISYVPQEPLLFHRTIRENIAYGRPNASDDEIASAARRAQAHTFIAALPGGYDTIVGERGVKLSGGQRQRIAIARAILKDAPILVLDEATSALDSESEKLIQKSLDSLMRGRTAIVVAHRLSTIQKMDRIIVLENGAITEEGTHDSLLKRRGTYAKLWAHQSGGFIEE